MILDRTQAIQDTQDLNKAAQNELLNSVLPQLNASVAGAGASGDAMAALLRSNAASNLAANVASQRADTIAKYEQVGTGQRQLNETIRHDQNTEAIARADQHLRDIINQRDNATSLQLQNLRGSQAVEQLLLKFQHAQSLASQQQNSAALDLFNQAQMQRYIDLFQLPAGAGTGASLPANSQDNPYSWVFGG